MIFKLINFDWDGTLADTRHTAYLAMETVFYHFNLEPPSKDEFLKHITSQGMLAFYHERGVPKNITRADLAIMFQKYFNDPENHKNLILRPGAIETLTACRSKGIKISIVSGSAHNVISIGVDKFKMSNLIDHIQADAGDKIDELRLVGSRFSAEPNEAIYVDDTYEGLSAAKKVGMTAVGITGGFSEERRLLEAGPDFLIPNLQELLPLL